MEHIFYLYTFHKARYTFRNKGILVASYIFNWQRLRFKGLILFEMRMPVCVFPE